jgi:dCTP deaminase
MLSDKQIKELDCMITPFVDHMVREEEGKKVISYGLGSYGYDCRLSREFKKFMPSQWSVIDPKDSSQYERSVLDHYETGDYFLLLPHAFVLAKSVEYFKMPEDVTGICLGKSTYARCGLLPLMTPLEAGWEGFLVLEFSNQTDLPVKLYINEGVFQVLFFRGEPCITSYRARGGKYQGQQTIVLPMA